MRDATYLPDLEWVETHLASCINLVHDHTAGFKGCGHSLSNRVFVDGWVLALIDTETNVGAARAVDGAATIRWFVLLHWAHLTLPFVDHACNSCGTET